MDCANIGEIELIGLGRHESFDNVIYPQVLPYTLNSREMAWVNFTYSILIVYKQADRESDVFLVTLKPEKEEK